MRNLYWNQWDGGGPRDFYERNYRRQSLAAWDAKWQQLSVPARYAFLHVVKLPHKDPAPYGDPPSSPKEDFPAHVLDELIAAGFARIERRKPGQTTDRVLAGAGISDFAWRGRILRRMHLLNADLPTELSKYVDEVFFRTDLAQAIVAILQTIGFSEGYYRLDELLERFIISHRWHDFVTRAFAEPLAKPILKAIKEAGAPIPLLELCGRIGRNKPEMVRAVVDQLIGHLVLFEDFQPETWEILVGFLPAVREKIIEARPPRERPPLQVCKNPKELAPHGSVLVNDLASILLEIANAPPRLRANHELYQREIDRFLSVLDPLPAWLINAIEWSTPGRLGDAFEWAKTLHLVKEVAEGRTVRLQLSAAGSRWLSNSVVDKHAVLINHFTRSPARENPFEQYEALLNPGPRRSRAPVSDESQFFGEQVTIQKLDRRAANEAIYERADVNWGIVQGLEQLVLRPHVERALAALEPGVFYRLDSVAAHLAFGEYNPLNAGLPLDRTRVTRARQQVPSLKEEREEAGKSLIDTFMRCRLIPLGCVRAAIDSEGNVCVARELSCELYFGHKVDLAGLFPLSDQDCRVVIQPDFSVVVIGLNTASLSELTPLCERLTKRGGNGATILKITRNSIVRAVRLGLKPDDIISRLTRLASNELPANVRREVKEWSSWVRHVKLSKMTVIRCDAQDSADRVMTVLRHQAERISETIVAIDHAKLTASERDKLLGQGIIVQTDADVLVNHAQAIGDELF
jgi:Helicase conserved C-terminal domain